MSNRSQKPIYEPPTVRDISGSVTKGGAGPLGLCQSGSSPFEDTCKPGTNPTQSPLLCSPTGNDPAVGGCSGGTGPAQYCGVGSIASS